MIDKVHLDSILESALRALIARRCKRAYIHEFRNSLQTVYVGMDMVARLLSGKAGTVSQDRVLEMARRAIQGHEQTFTATMQHLAGECGELSVVDTPSVLQEIAAFLGNDAAAHGVAIHVTAPGTLQFVARPENCRLVLLSVVTHAIDAMKNGGEIAIEASSVVGEVIIAFTLTPSSADFSDGMSWHFGDTPEPAGENWALNATRRLVLDDGGGLDSNLESGKPRSLRVCLRYQAAKPSSLDNEPPLELPSA